MTEILTFVRENTVAVIVAALFGFSILSAIAQTYGVITWYFITLVVAMIFAWVSGGLLYAYAFALGMVTAFAEIIGTFSDEPIKALKTPHALFYHLLNGAIAAFALRVLFLNDVPMTMPLDQLKVVLAAGLGSMLVMRSKLFNIKVGDEDVAFGPEQIIKVFFRYMQEAIDRVRAQSRIEFVTARMNNVDFKKVYDYSITMLQSSQVLEKDHLDALKAEIEKIRDGDPEDTQLKSYRLGFILQKRMGEDFVNKLFEKTVNEWMIRAPVAETKKDEGLGLVAKFPFLAKKEDTVNYFAYGSSMSTRRFSERLGWSDSNVAQWIPTTRPRKCDLKGYRLIFNKPDSTNSLAGTANIIKDEKGNVEGVLYQLTKAAVDFLDRSEGGYRRESIKVLLDGTEEQALTYIATSTQDGLKPTKEYLDLVVQGGKEHGLRQTYIAELEKTDTFSGLQMATGA